MNRRKWIYIGILIVVAAIVSIASFSYAFLTRVDEQHGKINIVAGTLDYKIESDYLENNSITLSANESKEIEITIKSLNTIDSKYQLYTNNVENIDIRYTAEEEPGVGTITSNGTKTIKVVLENNSDTDKTITFGVQGGFEDKTLTLEDNRVAVVLGDGLCKIGDVYNFDYNGTNGSDGSVQEFTTKCSGTYKIEAWGAQGTGDGGYGGYTSGLIQLEKGIDMYLYVGGQTTISYDYTVGGYNGGGYGTTYGEVSGYTNYSYAGGGATDIRITDGVWSNFASLKSRIMVAAGGAGKQYNNKNGLTGAIPGYGGGINGGAASGQKYSTFPQPTGATQINGGIGENSSYNGLFGMSIQSSPNNCWGSGGGSGYYGGAYGCGAAGSGGSSFISGYSGCNAIAESSTSSNIIHTNQSNHYSGLVFTNAVMIDGKGCNWSTGSATNCGANQPQPDGTNAIGHSGNGYARITYLGKRTVTFNANGGEVSETLRKVNYGYEIGELPTPAKTGKIFLGWYTDTNYTTKVDSVYKVEDNITLYAAWGTEVNLNLVGRTRGYPNDTTVSNTTKRTWNTNTYVVGLSGDNYYGPGWVSNYSIGANAVTVASGCGYGVAIPLTLENDEMYMVTPNVLPFYYTSDGTYSGYTQTISSSDNDRIFMVSSNTQWVLFDYGGGGQCTSEGIKQSKTYSDIHLYKLD